MNPKLERLAPVFILLLIVLFFAKIVFSNLVLATGDILLFFFPYWSAAISALRAGTIPYWNDMLFMGAPLAANSQVGFFYPLNWPMWLLFSAGQAISAAIILHLAIAGFGSYAMARQCLQLGRLASVIAGILFSLGGYLTSQVEHVNQLQGLALLPWFFVVLCHWQRSLRSYRSIATHAAMFAVLFALQLLTGHLQTTFITSVAILAWLVVGTFLDIRDAKKMGHGWRNNARSFFRRLLDPLTPLLIGVLVAILIASIQLLPTIELASQSTRQGGLAPSEALSFSYHPLLFTKSLLPLYEDPIFSEYVAVLPVSAILLALIALFTGKRDRKIWLAGFLAIFGIFMALGAFNPLYHLLVRLPVFDYFRAPARWLALYALGISLLAAVGWQKIADAISTGKPIGSKAEYRRSLLIGVGLIIILLIWGIASTYLVEVVPVGQEITIQVPGTFSWVGWLVELIVGVVLLLLAGWHRSKLAFGLLTILMVLALYLGTRQLPYNDPTTPEAYTDLRPPITRLQDSDLCEDTEICTQPPSRLLSMSEIFFDVGDQTEIDTIYSDQLPASAQYDYTIAMKHKEVLSPNLPLGYGVSSIDGFDGGLLPLSSYTVLTQLLLPNGRSSIDGRLREFMEEVPDDRYLDLLNVRFLITDKVGDQWQDEVFYDRQIPVTVGRADQPVSIGFLPEFEATEVRILSHGEPGALTVATDGGQSWLVEPGIRGDGTVEYTFPEPAIASSISLISCAEALTNQACYESWQVEAVSLVDQREDTFYPLVSGQYKLIHSGDVKIYENLDVLPRAFLVDEWTYAPDEEASLSLLESPEFEPKNQAVLIGAGQDKNHTTSTGSVLFKEYRPGYVALESSSEEPALLVMTDSFYPGWQATIDGDPAEIVQANVLFRGIIVPGGEHEVIFEYQADVYRLGALLTAAGLAAIIVMVFIALAKRDKS